MSSDSESVGSSTRTFSPNPNQGLQNYQTATVRDPPHTNQRRSVENDECFSCKQKGHWAKDCPLKSKKKSQRLESSSGQIDNPEFPQKQCPCCEGACLILTSKTKKNPGRKFYKCPAKDCTCDFFEWCDTARFGQRPNVPMPPYPMCSCGAGKCRLLTSNMRRDAGQKYFVCPVKKDQDPIDSCSDESLHLSYSQSVSDNDEKDTEAATDCKQAEGDGCEQEIVLSNGSNESGPLSSLCAERSLVKKEMGHHHPPIKKCGLLHEGGESDGDWTIEKGSPSLPGEGFQLEAGHHLLIEKLDLNEEGEGDGDRMEGVLLYGSIENDCPSSAGKEFQVQVGRHSPIEGLEEGYNNGLEDVILHQSIEKGPLSSSSEGFEVVVDHHPPIERLNLHEQGVGDDDRGEDISFDESIERGPVSSSGGGSEVEEVGHHLPSKEPGLHIYGGTGNVNGRESASFNTSNGKGSQPLPSTGSGVDKVGHRLQIEELGSQGETTNSVVVQPRKCSQSGQQRHWMKGGSRSRRSICFKCGKVGHSKEDCTT
ncbi:uncharacterized protein LOC131246564 isoform X2 [Magnolia sinica]|uniref:uncharacterized protein LOC131246564 isoform X2 n=1 Tax=Magnolia sinica TaxID=86752 RepID=UPI00265917BE|nr:uncharacterized protein LOC131246564 isoform X2 [Magnolia sinica]